MGWSFLVSFVWMLGWFLWVFEYFCGDSGGCELCGVVHGVLWCGF